MNSLTLAREKRVAERRRKRDQKRWISLWVSCGAIIIITLLVFLLAYFLRPPDRTETIVHTMNENATRPMDVVVLLDASGSMRPLDWEKEVEFARRVIIKLHKNFVERNATFRVSLGQFSTSVKMEMLLSSHVDGLYTHLRTWQCLKRWDELPLETENSGETVTATAPWNTHNSKCASLTRALVFL